MEHIFNGEIRNELGKGATGRLRRDGRIPAVLYGHNDAIHFSLDSRSFHKDVQGVSENTIVTISVDGTEYDALIKDFQYEPLKDLITHIDFFEVERGKTLRTHIPVHLEGTAPGVKSGGALNHILHDVEVECLPKDIPEAFTLDISSMEMGDLFRVSDLAVPSTIKVLTDEDRTVVNVVAPKSEEESSEEELGEESGNSEA